MGSGIIFNGGSGGGASVNPTSTYMPVNSGGTFVDSIIQCLPNTFAQSMRGASGFGFGTSVLGTSCQSWLGDWNNQIDNVYIEVKNDVTQSRIFTSNRGFKLDYVINRYIFGDYNNIYNGVNLYIDDQNRFVSFTDNNVIDGLFLNYALSTFQFGKITANSLFTIDAIQQFAQITLNSAQQLLLDAGNYMAVFFEYANGNGFKIDGTNSVFDLKSNLQNVIYVDYNGTPTDGNIQIGKFNSRAQIIFDYVNSVLAWGAFSGNNTQMNIDDNNQEILFNTQNLIFQGANLEDPASGGFANNHLVITLNGNLYKIRLEYP